MGAGLTTPPAQPPSAPPAKGLAAITRAGLVAAVLIGTLAGVPAPAWAQLVVVGSPDLSISRLSAEEAAQFFLGRRKTLDDGTPVTLVDLPAGAARDRFYQQLTDKNPSQIRAYWSRLVFTGRALPPLEAPSAQDARKWIAAGPHTIGYLPEAEAGKDLRVLLRLP